MLARELGDVRADVNPLAEASIIISSIRGVLFQWLINPDHVSLSHMRDCLIANVRTTLRAERDPRLAALSTGRPCGATRLRCSKGRRR